MILVTLGTSEPFDRLLLALDRLPPGEELVVQRGASTLAPRGARCIDFLEFDELVAEVRRARVVVTHAGAGSVMTALAHGKRPVVMPRLHRLGEAVDDHQVPFARRLAAAGLVTLVEDPELLAETLAGQGERPAVSLGRGGRLVADLRGYLVERIGTPEPARP